MGKLILLLSLVLLGVILGMFKLIGYVLMVLHYDQITLIDISGVNIEQIV
jgi:hypothetical protein